MRIRFVAAALIAVLVAGTARANMVDDCVNEAKNYRRAVEACTDAINSGQWTGADLAWAYTNRGLAYYELKEFTRALADYSEALQLDPYYYDAHYARGAAYCDMGRWEQAVQWYTTAIEGGSWKAREAQEYLKGEGHYYGPINGRFDSETEDALYNWARSYCRKRSP